MNAELNIREEILQRIARLHVMGVQPDQIARAVGLDPARVAALIEQHCTALIADEQNRVLDRDFTLDEAWNAAEEDALSTLLLQMQTVPDPMFALSVAKTANLARRRGVSALNRPIDGRSEAVRSVTITLNTQYVTQLQMTENRALELNHRAKRVDTLDVVSTQKLLQRQAETDIDEVFSRISDPTDVEYATVPA